MDSKGRATCIHERFWGLGAAGTRVQREMHDHESRDALRRDGTDAPPRASGPRQARHSSSASRQPGPEGSSNRASTLFVKPATRSSRLSGS